MSSAPDTQPIAAGIPGSQTMHVDVSARQPRPVITGEACCGKASGAVPSEITAETTDDLIVMYAKDEAYYEASDPLGLQLDIEAWAETQVDADGNEVPLSNAGIQDIARIMTHHGGFWLTGTPRTTHVPTNTQIYQVHLRIQKWVDQLGKSFGGTRT